MPHSRSVTRNFYNDQSNQLAQASATNEARLKAMWNCNNMPTPPSVSYRPYRGLVFFFESWQIEITVLLLEVYDGAII